MTHPRLSVSALCSVRWSFDEDLRLWCDLDLQWAGLLGTKLGPKPESELRTLGEAGMRPSTIVGPRFDLARADTWSVTRDRLHRLIDAAAAAGGWSVYLTPGRSTGATWEELLETFADVIAPSVAHARDCGVRLGFEPSRRLEVSFVNSMRDAVAVAERTGLGIVADIGNFWMERDLDDLLRSCAPHLCLVQLTDVVIGTVSSPDEAPSGGRVAIGEGELPIARIMRSIAATAYGGPLEIEIVGPLVPQQSYESVIRRAVVSAAALLSEVGMDGTVTAPPSADHAVRDRP